MAMKVSTELQYFLSRNVSTEPYELLKLNISEYYPKLVIDFDSVHESIIKKSRKRP